MRRNSMSFGRRVWSATVAAVAVITAGAFAGPASDTVLVRPQLLFSLVTVAAVACVIAATIVIALADRRQLAELGLLGSALMAASVMPLVHGLVTPDVLYDDTSAFRASAFLSLPVAIAVAAPLLTPHSAFGRWASRRWRDWTLLSLVGVFAVGALLVAYPSAIPDPEPTNPVTITVTLILAACVMQLSWRQLRYFDLGGQLPNLAAALSLVLLAATGLLPLVVEDYSLAFWWLHLTGVAGVLGACIGLALSKRTSPTTHDVLAPVLARDPLVAFELGLSPVVRRFVASLDGKDPLTRDHVVRTAEMAIRVGERFRLPARALRELGLAALLHDVGKLETPSEILDKPSRLTDEEYEVVKQHAVIGERMLLAEPTLASIAPIVRSHHERIDGRGYPDGLSGEQIPLASRIVAVCDALDAMTHEHRFRHAMHPRMAFAVLREHAGSQWDPRVIDHVLAVYPAMASSSALADVGREDDSYAQPAGAGGSTLVEADELLISVDAKI